MMSHDFSIVASDSVKFCTMVLVFKCSEPEYNSQQHSQNAAKGVWGQAHKIRSQLRAARLSFHVLICAVE